MRVLTWGRRLWSIHQGGIHSGKPSSLMRHAQPFVGSGCGVPAQQSQVANTALRIPSAVLREPALRAPLGGPGSRSHHCPGPRRTEPAVSQSSPRTTLAEGAITQSDYLVIELVAPQGHPQMITIGWPAQATPVRPAAYAETASKIMRIVARANIELARLKISRH